MSFPFERIRHLLIDLDGVLYVGNTALPGAAQFIGWLRTHGIGFQLVTNNSTLTPQLYVEKLAAMGITIEPPDIYTSALATAQFLTGQSTERQTVYAVGEEGLLAALREAGIGWEEEHPDWVVSGLDRTLTYDKLATAARAIRSGARYVATNPDTSLPTEGGLLPGAGAIGAAITAATDVAPLVIGKPEPTMLKLALQRLGATAANTAMLGDRLDTDIQGAAATNMLSILVLTGVSRRDDLDDTPYPPDLVVGDLAELMRLWPVG